LTGPLINIFNTEDPFFKIVSMIIVIGFASLCLSFVTMPTMLTFFLIPAYVIAIAIFNWLATPMIVEPQALTFFFDLFL
jgi:hypothetical protein